MDRIKIATRAHSELYDITPQIEVLVDRSQIRSGVVHIFVPHTTAGVTINENADPDVKTDLLQTLEKMVPWQQAHFRHAEGNSAAHIKAGMMGFSTVVQIDEGRLALGTWQSIYFCEFDGPRARQVWVTIQGSPDTEE